MSNQCNAVVGQPAPAFQGHAIIDGRIKEISLSSYTDAHHWMVLIFFPKAWSFICPTEIRSFSTRLDEFLYQRSCAVAFASTDSEFCLRAWNNTSELEGGLGGTHVPLISDASHKLCRNYGVLIEDLGVAQRALFIIDPKGILRCTSVNDVDVGRSVDEVIRILDALAYKDEYGEGCAADWRKGDKGIDIASKSKIDGSAEIEIRKSWANWARPKLARAWSGASHASGASSVKMDHASRGASADSSSLPTLSKFSTHGETKATVSQRPHSMYLAPLTETSPHGGHDTLLDKEIAHIKIEQARDNDQAAAANREIGTVI